MDWETIIKIFVLPVLPPGTSVESCGRDPLLQATDTNSSRNNKLQKPFEQSSKQQPTQQPGEQQKQRQQRGRDGPEVHPRRNRDSLVRARSVAVTASAVQMKLGKKAHRYAGPGFCEGYDFMSIKFLDGNLGADVQDRYKIQQEIRKQLSSAEHSR